MEILAFAAFILLGTIVQGALAMMIKSFAEKPKAEIDPFVDARYSQLVAENAAA